MAGVVGAKEGETCGAEDNDTCGISLYKASPPPPQLWPRWVVTPHLWGWGRGRLMPAQEKLTAVALVDKSTKYAFDSTNNPGDIAFSEAGLVEGGRVCLKRSAGGSLAGVHSGPRIGVTASNAMA